MTEHEPRLKLRAGAVWQEVDGETVVLDVQESTYLGVNESGSVLWSALTEGATRAELVARLRATYPLSAERAGADVDAFLDSCRDRGVLETG